MKIEKETLNHCIEPMTKAAYKMKGKEFNATEYITEIVSKMLYKDNKVIEKIEIELDTNGCDGCKCDCESYKIELITNQIGKRNTEITIGLLNELVFKAEKEDDIESADKLRNIFKLSLEDNDVYILNQFEKGIFLKYKEEKK